MACDEYCTARSAFNKDKELVRRGQRLVCYRNDCNICVNKRYAGEGANDGLARWIGRQPKLCVNEAKIIV